MRPLNDYFIDGGSFSALQTPANANANMVVPDGGNLLAIAFNILTGTMTADTTCDILINGVDSGVDITIPNSPALSGGVAVVPAKLRVEQGDTIRLTSNGETAGTITAHTTYIIRR